MTPKKKRKETLLPKQGMKRKLFRILRILAPVFVCGLLIGYGLGKHWSPNYDDPAEIAQYVAANVKPLNPSEEIIYEEKLNELGQPSTFKPKESGLYFECEIRGYSYSPGKPASSKGIPERVPHTHRKHLDLKEIFALLYGSIESLKLAIQFPKFVSGLEKLTAAERLQFYAAGAIALGSGAALGIRFGYEDSPDCASTAFSDNLGTETFWQTVYAEYMQNHSIFFVYDDLGLPRIDWSRGIGAVIASNKPTDIIRALEAVPQFKELRFEAGSFSLWFAAAVRDVNHGLTPRFWICEDQLAKVNPRRARKWESEIYSWSFRRGPVAARILTNRRFKGDIMVVLRRWIIDQHGNFQTCDFISSRSTQKVIELECELKTLNWRTSPPSFCVSLTENSLFDVSF